MPKKEALKKRPQAQLMIDNEKHLIYNRIKYVSVAQLDRATAS